VVRRERIESRLYAVAACCSVLQRVAVCRKGVRERIESRLYAVAACCGVLRRVAACCSVSKGSEGEKKVSALL